MLFKNLLETYPQSEYFKTNMFQKLVLIPFQANGIRNKIYSVGPSIELLPKYASWIIFSLKAEIELFPKTKLC
jgi:hypothetical protein